MKIKNKFIATKPHAVLSTGEVIRMLRELKGWTQAELARRSGISVTNISLLENERIELCKKRAVQFAKTFDVHPAIIMFPEPGRMGEATAHPSNPRRMGQGSRPIISYFF